MSGGDAILISATNEMAADRAPAELPALGSIPEMPSMLGRPAARRAAPWGRAFHQGFFSLADQAVASIANFVTGVIIARSCSKESFGLYMLGLTIVLLVTDLQASLIATPYMVYAPRLKGEARAQYTGSTLIHQLLLSLITMVCLIGAAFATRLGFGPRGLGPVMWALAATVSLIMLREFARRMCFARLAMKTALLLDTCTAVGQLTGLFLLARFGLMSTPRAYWLIGSVCGIVVLSWLWLDRKSYDLHLGRALADFQRNWSVGKWVFGSGLLWTASTNIYPWLLASFHGTAAAGVFAACLGVVSASNPILLGVQNLVGPRVAHEFAAKGPRALRVLVLRISAVLAIPVTLLTVVLIVWGDRFIGLLYGHRYAGNGAVVAVLALNLLVTALAFAFSRALFAIERADLDFQLNVATIVIMLTAGIWLVRTYGPLGAASGLLLANVATSILRAGLFLRLPMRVSEPLEAHV